MPPQDNPMGGPPGAMTPWNPTRQQLDQLEQILKRMMKDQQPTASSAPPSPWPSPQNLGSPPPGRPAATVPGNFGYGSPGYGSPSVGGAMPGPQVPAYQNAAAGPWSPPSSAAPASNPFGGFPQPYSNGPTPANPPGATWLEPGNSWNPSATTWAPLAETWKQNPGAFPVPIEAGSSTALRPTASGSASTGLGAIYPDRLKPVPLATVEPINETGLSWLVNQLVDLPLYAIGPPGRFFMGSAGRYLMGLLGLGMVSYAALIVASDWLDWSWADQLLPWQLVGRFFSFNRS